MTRRQHVMSAGRGGLLGLALGLAAALVAALAIGWRTSAAAGWWEAGYVRLIADAVSDRFDRFAAPAAALGAVAGAAAAVAGVRAGRRTRAAAVSAALLVASLRAGVAADAWRERRGPNVLLVSIDTLRADHLGAYGSALPTSPTIDARLAGQGVTFDAVYSQSPKTTPSHMTMLTSLYPCVHGVELWETNTPGRVLNPAVHTLAEVLKDAGWATAAFTAGGNVHRMRGFGHGFDVYRHGQQLARATEWIRAHRARKWFVFFHTYDVHDPYVPPAELVSRFDGDYRGPLRETVDRLRAGTGAGDWDKGHDLFWASVDARDRATVRFVEHLYDAAIRHMDEATVAPLLDLLDRLDLARDTLVVFTSDHGEAFAEHGRFLHDDLYAGTLHVPLILRFPGRLPPGRRVAARARLLDVMPTVLDLVGVPAPPAAEGRSLVRLVQGNTSADADVVSEHDNVMHGRRFESVRRGSLAYVVNGAAESLYDVARDPREDVDVAPSRPADVEAMRAVLAGWRDECRRGAARLGARDGGVLPDDETRRRLHALGYVE